MSVDTFIPLSPPVRIILDQGIVGMPLLPRPLRITDQFKGKSVIWRNDNTKSINFSDANTCIRLEIDKIFKIDVENIRPAKGSGASYLIVHYCITKNKAIKRTLLMGNYKNFDTSLKKIGALSECTVEILQEQVDT